VSRMKGRAVPSAAAKPTAPGAIAFAAG
jgi:hypothetical protein